MLSEKESSSAASRPSYMSITARLASEDASTHTYTLVFVVSSSSSNLCSASGGRFRFALSERCQTSTRICAHDRKGQMRQVVRLPEGVFLTEVLLQFG